MAGRVVQQRRRQAHPGAGAPIRRPRRPRATVGIGAASPAAKAPPAPATRTVQADAASQARVVSSKQLVDERRARPSRRPQYGSVSQITGSKPTQAQKQQGAQDDAAGPEVDRQELRQPAEQPARHGGRPVKLPRRGGRRPPPRPPRRWRTDPAPSAPVAGAPGADRPGRRARRPARATDRALRADAVRARRACSMRWRSATTSSSTC